MSWAWLPDAIVEVVVKLVPADSLPSLCRAERRCHAATIVRLATLRPLSLPPFSIDAWRITGRRFSFNVTLSDKNLGDADLQTLASAMASGALPHCALASISTET